MNQAQFEQLFRERRAEFRETLAELREAELRENGDNTTYRWESASDHRADLLREVGPLDDDEDARA